jgi:hypothetical protein
VLGIENVAPIFRDEDQMYVNARTPGNDLPIPCMASSGTPALVMECASSTTSEEPSFRFQPA